MSQEQYDSNEVLIAKNIQILPVLNFHLGHLLKSVAKNYKKANIEKARVLGS